MSGTLLRLPYDLLKRGRKATDQQLCCLGVDVRVEGFPLDRLGWEFHPRPDKKRGCARLTGILPSEGHLSMWGFGFVVSDAVHGACWMDRRSFRPKWAQGFAPNRSVFEKKDLPSFNAARTASQANDLLFLLSELALRLAEHEEDVLSILGMSYREKCLADWPHAKTALTPEELPLVWRSISEEALNLRTDEYALTLEHQG